MEENVGSKHSRNSHERSNWRPRGRGGRFNHAIHYVSEEHDNTQLSLNSNLEDVISQHSSNICGRRSWRSRGRNGRYNHDVHSVSKEHSSVQRFQNSDLLAAESSGANYAVTAVSRHSSSLLISDPNTARRSWRSRGGNRRPWHARSTNRSESVPIMCEPDCSSFQRTEDCSSSSSSIASTADTCELVEVEMQQTNNVFTVGSSIVINNSRKNARQHGHKRFVHGNRGQLSSRYSMHQQSDSVNFESEPQCNATCSTAVENEICDQLELESEADKCFDDQDDDDGDGDDGVDVDVLKDTSVPVAERGKPKHWDARTRGFRGNRRSHSRARVLGHKHMLISQQETNDTESAVHCIPVEASVQDAVTEEGSKLGARPKNFKQKAANIHQESHMASDASVSAADNSDVKRANIKHGKNSASRISASIDENSLFWHLVNEHSGKCCIEELKNQLNTSDPNTAITMLTPLKRIKILKNESDKWMSVAFVFIKGLRMCINVRAGCKKEDCSFLHVCPYYVTESCNHGLHCRFGHNVRIPRNESCLQKSGIPESCSNESILTIARSSNLIICSGYNGIRALQCHSPVQCIRLHVCNYFFCGRCLVPNSECVLGHELTSQHNVRLLMLYEAKHLLNDEKLKILHRMILSFNSAAHSQTHHASGEIISKMTPMMPAQQTDKRPISACVAVVQPTVRTRVQLQKAQHEMKNTVMPSLISDGELLAQPDTQPTSSHQGQQPVALQKFVISRELTSKTSSVPAEIQLTKSAEDECTGSLLSASTVQPKSNELPAQMQSNEFDIAGVRACELLSDMTKSVGVNKTFKTGQLDTMQRLAIRCSPSTNTLGFRANQCQTYVKHLCNESNECTVRHDSLPYLWRVQDAGKWVAFDDSVSIEKAFCGPDNNTCPASCKGAGCGMNAVLINFCEMQCSIGKVQRLSTPSYVTCRTKCDATRWCWYWNCGNSAAEIWILYEDTKPPYQDVLEARFLADAEVDCCFEVEECQYELNFATMTQTNIRTQKRRQVSRRPYFVSELDIRTGGLPPAMSYYDPDKLPVNEGWLPMDTETPAWTDLVPVSPKHRRMQEMYVRVCAKFYATLSRQDYRVSRIYRVQNLDLWNKYQTMKLKMEKLPHLAAVGVNEQKLFHGTPDERTVRCICNQNFDPRMYGRHGTVYGKGVYFSTTAQYSNQYTTTNSGRRFMFLARVLVGKSALGKSELQRPPPIDPSRPHGALYDSCINSTSNPTIFVIFDNDQCYPEFLIEYEECEKDGMGTLSGSVAGSATQPQRSAVAAAMPASRHSPASAGPPPQTSHQFSNSSSTRSLTTPVSPASSAVPQSQATPVSKSRNGCAVM